MICSEPDILTVTIDRQQEQHLTDRAQADPSVAALLLLCISMCEEVIRVYVTDTYDEKASTISQCTMTVEQ